jgi:glycosyltransferase involved in cell wall biosynthesis
MRSILHSYPETKLLLAGEGPSRKELEDFVQQNRLSDSVQFLGLRKDTPLLLKAMDILVSSSTKEAFAINLIEAMYMGLPCVATNIGGTPELVIDGQTGILVEPADSEALSRAIKELLNRPDLAKEYGEAGKKRALESFTMDKYIVRLEKLYDQLTAY